MGVKIDDLDLPGEAEIDKNRFNTPLLATLPEDFVVDSSTPSSRVSHSGRVFVFERVGSALVYDSAFADPGLGRSFTNNASSDISFIREGTFDDTGASLSWFGFKDGDTSMVIQAMVVTPDGAPATAEDLDTLRRVQCGVAFQGLSLECS